MKFFTGSVELRQMAAAHDRMMNNVSLRCSRRREDVLPKSRESAWSATRRAARRGGIRFRQQALTSATTILLALNLGAEARFVPSSITPPTPLREFRGAWVATVGNIDWPSKKGLSTAEQKAELIAIMDRAAQLKLNALIFQIRPGCDALYASQFEPWSEYLTGTMGKAPQPFYDPLAFAIEEAHKRGLELHAWFNPYRARHQNAQSPVAANHISRTRPDLVREYGKYLWLDPGEQEVQEHSLRVVMDVVKRYDVDGVHFDDYFYPYREKDSKGLELDFPDDGSWRRFGAGGKRSREDWRRGNVNTFVRRVHESIKAAKPWVKFGVSPFGIWRPHHPPQIKGFDAYEKLYADSRLWLQQGWLDYFAPQLYWAIEPKEQSFPVLLKWWAAQNSKQRFLWPGMNTTKAGREWPAAELVNQIKLARTQSGVSGHLHWNMKSLMRNRDGLAGLLERQVYTEPALVPAMTWVDARSPDKPVLKVSADRGRSACQITWRPAGEGQAARWLLQWRTLGTWSCEVLPGEVRSHAFAAGRQPEVLALTAVDRCGNPSKPTVFERKGQ